MDLSPVGRECPPLTAQRLLQWARLKHADIHIVNNLNVDYSTPIPTKSRLYEGLDMTTQTTIRSDITGMVWKIVVQEGAALQADDTIMVLESMKMEIPVLAPESGRLIKLLIAEGTPVREGQEIAIFEEE
jgi:urea carboxylase